MVSGYMVEMFNLQPRHSGFDSMMQHLLALSESDQYFGCEIWLIESMYVSVNWCKFFAGILVRHDNFLSQNRSISIKKYNRHRLLKYRSHLIKPFENGTPTWY